MNLNYGFEHAEIYNESNQKYYEYYKRSQVQEEMIDKIFGPGNHDQTHLLTKKIIPSSIFLTENYLP